MDSKPKPTECAFTVEELEEKERAYRRGALQAIQCIAKDLIDKSKDNQTFCVELISRIGDWEQALILGRDNLNIKYLGNYMDAIKGDVDNAVRSTRGSKEEGT